jgi:hypothetical protein
MDPAAALAFAADGTTAGAGAFNAAVLVARRARERSARRRTAVAVLGLLNAGIAVSAAFAQATYAAHRFDVALAPFFAPLPWLTSRALLLAGTLGISLLIMRRNGR